MEFLSISIRIGQKSPDLTLRIFDTTDLSTNGSLLRASRLLMYEFICVLFLFKNSTRGFMLNRRVVLRESVSVLTAGIGQIERLLSSAKKVDHQNPVAVLDSLTVIF
jgi:hypothetical protein